MNPEQSPFQTGWFSLELPKVRPCRGTYCLFPYESLPPIDTALLRGDLRWLTPLSPQMQEAQAAYQRPDAQQRVQTQLAQLITNAQNLGLTLPPVFLRFMGDLTLQDQIPSVTACYFDLPDHLLKSPLGDGYLLRFLNDQQDVLMWHLYLTQNGDHAVIVSPIEFDIPELEVTSEEVRHSTFFCAPDIETFLYRFWLENTLWFALVDGKPLTPPQTAYIDFYNQQDA